MSAHEELLAAAKYVRDRTGDPNAWPAGLSPSELAAVITPTTRPEQLQAIAGKIRQQDAAAPDREKGEAAEAIARAEVALSHQNSASSQLDMQVITAILNAHLNAVEGSQAGVEFRRPVGVHVVEPRGDVAGLVGLEEPGQGLGVELGPRDPPSTSEAVCCLEDRIRNRDGGLHNR